MSMTTFTPKNVARFCEMLAETGQVGKSARAIGVSRMTVWNWRQKHPKFREAWDAALKIATTTLEDEAWRRAHEGNEEPVYHNGECVGMVRKYSDTLLIFLLKACDPAKYREKFQADAPRQEAPSNADLLEIAKKIAFIMTRANILVKDIRGDDSQTRGPAFSDRN